MAAESPSNAVYYSSIILVGFIYFSSIFVFIEIRKFVQTVNFNDEFFQCRQPILSITYIGSFLFVLYVLNPVTLFLSNIYGINSSIPLLVNDIADILIFLTFFPRAWILWYDRAFVDNLKNWLWRREINGQDQNFLIKYRGIMRSSHLLVYSVYLLLISPIFVTLHILPYLNVIPLPSHIMRTVLLILLLLATFYSVKCISVVSDEWSIRKELLCSIKTTGICYIFAHLTYIIFAQYIDEYWALFMELLFVFIADIFVIYYSCHWTRKQFEFLQKVRLIRTLKTEKGRRSSFSSFISKRIQLQDIMDHKEGVDAFCNHLKNEFGLESVLFLIEAVQFKAIIRLISNGTFPDNVGELINCRRRTIIHDEASKEHIFSAAWILDIDWLPIDDRMYSLTPYEIALHLYDKYIEESADLCINISFGIRKTIYRYFQEISQQQIQIKIDDEKHEGLYDMNELNKIYRIYDEAFTEIWRLIQTDSFLRFKSTDSFRRLISVLFPDEAISANKHLVEMIDDEIRKKAEKEKEKRNLTPLKPVNSSSFRDFSTILTSAMYTKRTNEPLPTLQYKQQSLPQQTKASEILKIHHSHSVPIGNINRSDLSNTLIQ